MRKATATEAQLLSSTELANRYGVSVHYIEMWRRYEGFPRNAVFREGIRLFYDYRLTDAWLRNRKVSSTGWRPRWLEIVGHPAASEKA